MRGQTEKAGDVLDKERREEDRASEDNTQVLSVGGVSNPGGDEPGDHGLVLASPRSPPWPDSPRSPRPRQPWRAGWLSCQRSMGPA